MEQILNKLSEIETTASYIMEESSTQKQELTQQLEEQCHQFDAKVDQETSNRVADIRQQLEADKENEISRLRSHTQEMFAQMDAYYAANRSRLVRELYNKILEG